MQRSKGKSILIICEMTKYNVLQVAKVSEYYEVCI